MLSDKQYVILWGIYLAALPGVTHIYHDEQAIRVYDLIAELDRHKNSLLRKKYHPTSK